MLLLDSLSSQRLIILEITVFEKLVDYYRRCSEVEEDAEGKIMRSTLLEIFKDVFGDLRILERDFHNHMATLKPDIERMRDAMK